MLGALSNVLGDKAAAEDCAQDTFERAYKSWSSWRPDAPVEAWLHRIAINVAVSDRRRARIRQAGELVRRLGRPPPAPDPTALAERSDLIRALRKLPTKQAAAIVFRHFHASTNPHLPASLAVPHQPAASPL